MIYVTALTIWLARVMCALLLSVGFLFLSAGCLFGFAHFSKAPFRQSGAYLKLPMGPQTQGCYFPDIFDVVGTWWNWGALAVPLKQKPDF